MLEDIQIYRYIKYVQILCTELIIQYQYKPVIYTVGVVTCRSFLTQRKQRKQFFRGLYNACLMAWTCGVLTDTGLCPEAPGGEELVDQSLQTLHHHVTGSLAEAIQGGDVQLLWHWHHDGGFQPFWTIARDRDRLKLSVQTAANCPALSVRTRPGAAIWAGSSLWVYPA